MRIKTKAPLELWQKVLVFLFIGVVLVLIFWLFRPLFVIVAEIYIWAAILLAFRYWPPMFQLVRKMTVPHRVVFLGLIFAVLLGHFTLHSRRFFPFVPWEIFSETHYQDSVPCRQLIGKTASGRQVRLLVEQLFPSIVQFNLPEGYTPAGATPKSTFLPYTPLLEKTMQAEVKMYNQLHPQDPVQEVYLVRRVVSLKNNPLNPGQQCTLLTTFPVSSAPSN